MGGSVTGGKKAALTNKERQGQDWYSRIGKIGGRNGSSGGFGAGEAGRERARTAGAIGGAISRRGDATKLTKAEATAARKRILSELSAMQTSKLSSKHGNQRPW